MRWILTAVALLSLYCIECGGNKHEKIVVRLRMASGGTQRASQRMVVDLGTTQWNDFMNTVRERMMLTLAAHPMLTLRDPGGVEVTSFGRLPRRSGSIVTVAAPKSPDAAAGILAQLQSAVSAMYEVPLP